jgi:uncharacterized protein (UPF0333 family)
MKQKMLIFLSFIFLIALLIGINAVSYTQKDKEPDTELKANRSTYNTGATGTRAFYDLLAETGRKVTRWQEAPTQLFNSSKRPDTFVIIGKTRLEIDKEETEQILRWVSEGGKLVIIDREPNPEFITTTANWTLKNDNKNSFASFNIDPSNQPQMTAEIPAIKPSQPSIYTRGVNAVQPSRFASSLSVTFGNSKEKPQPSMTPMYDFPATPKPTPMPTINAPPPTPKKGEELLITQNVSSPFVHVSDGQRNILVDYPYGDGQIVFLTDPYIVSNAGISLVDNARLGINIVASRDGIIAFDEYHQGYGANAQSVWGYFSGTPVIPIFGQIALFIGLIMFSQSRRFARPLPAQEPNRLSKLEYVSAMAELQQRTKAYDLAVENIFSEFRRSATRFLGMDNFSTSRKELAKAIAERTKLEELDVYNVMRKCEEVIRGEKTNKREVLELTSRLREIEEKLGIKRTRKQAFRRK